MVDKTLASLGHARNKAAEFLKKEVGDILLFYRLVKPLLYTRR